LQRSGAKVDTGRSIDDRQRAEVKIPIGKILLDSGKISSDQLKQALTLQKSTTEKLGRLLIDLGFVSEQDMLDAYAQQLNLPVVPDPSVANAIPEHLQKRYDVVSLRGDGTKLFVAMADPTNVDALDDLRLVTGFEIEPVPMTREEILAIRRSISDSDVEDTPIIRMVNVLIENAIKQGATEIQLQTDQRQVTVRYCLKGEFREVMTVPKFAHLPLVERLKIMSEIAPTAKLPHQGRFHIRHEHQDYDARVEIAPGEFGEVITIRISKMETT